MGFGIQIIELGARKPELVKIAEWNQANLFFECCGKSAL